MRLYPRDQAVLFSITVSTLRKLSLPKHGPSTRKTLSGALIQIWHFFPALFRSLMKSLGSEHTWNHSFRTSRQMERNSSLFPLFCLQGIFGISFRKWGCDPKPSLLSRLQFPTVKPAQWWHTLWEGELYLRTPTASCTSAVKLKSKTEREWQQERKWKSGLGKKSCIMYSSRRSQCALLHQVELQLVCFLCISWYCNKLRIKVMNCISDLS